jgi:hypothetical protein
MQVDHKAEMGCAVIKLENTICPSIRIVLTYRQRYIAQKERWCISVECSTSGGEAVKGVRRER